MKGIHRVLRIHILLTTLMLLFLPDVHGAETCEQWSAKVVKVQGSVLVTRSGQKESETVRLHDTLCPGDTLQVKGLSRAGILLPNETIAHLDQNTTLIILDPEKEQSSLIKLIKGIAHLMSRTPRALEVITPFINAGVEGTEFLIRVTGDETILSVFEGQIKAVNTAGTLTINPGESAIARAGQAPAPHVMVRPRDAVQWALYYPPVLDINALEKPVTETGWTEAVRKSAQHYREGSLKEAFESIQDVPDNLSDSHFYLYRASLLLNVGRVDKAEEDISRALAIQAGNSDAMALQSIIALAQNDKEKALSLAGEAAAADPLSAAAQIALSYAQQAGFNLDGALESVHTATELEQENSLAWARLAELRQSFNELDTALEAAQKAVSLNPDLSRTQTVLGYSYLTQLDTHMAMLSFLRAIMLDQGDPLPRMGLGLAMIRNGRLEEGRREIETAASLDPNNALVRSYLGKAYYEEKRDEPAESQYAISKKLDLFDPTPYFYDAIRKQSVNRPVEALQDLQKAIELNDNRAIYRSRQLLDDDLAARSASLARIYNNLGFQQLALVEGWKSVNVDPGNYSAHRFLADTYSALPRHEIARVSELLQSQLYQPININPVQPHLAESSLFILDGAGPGDLSFNEFNPLFNRNQISLRLNSVFGEHDTFGNELSVSGIYNNVSLSAGQFRYETDGYRKNNDLKEDIYNIFIQARLTHETSIQAEYRSRETQNGDLPLRFNPDDFLDSLREKERTSIIRLGINHALTPNSNLLGSFIYGKFDGIYSVGIADFMVPLPPPPFGPGPIPGHTDLDATIDEDDRYLAEIQHLFHSERLYTISGAGYFDTTRDDTRRITTTFKPEAPAFGINNMSSTTNIESPRRHANSYIYANVLYPKAVTWTIGGSFDHLQDRLLDLDMSRLNPKLGVTWGFLPSTTIRAAAFRILKRSLVSDQTLEPTQVAGFNQFYDDTSGTVAWRYGIGIDQNISPSLHGGLEFSERDLDVTYIHTTTNETRDADWKEQLGRIYLYWTPLDWLSFSSEYQYERFDRDPEYPGAENVVEIKTHRIPMGVRFFNGLGFSAMLQATHVDQEGDFGNIQSGVETGSDQFWIVDASFEYRLPRRWGIISIEGRNLFDENINFQDTDPGNPSIYPERLFLAKFTLAL